MSYDSNNIFAKIIRGDIPCKKIYEDEFVLSFHDIHPRKKVHALIIPKGAYVDATDFAQHASPEEITGFWRALPKIAAELGLENGYRLISNCQDHGHQEVPHLHFHLLGGEPVGAMCS
jgi:histidine triad (HIT) family protein